MMTNSVVIQNFAKDYFPFKFPGFGGPAHCFLRVNIFNSNVSVLCAQLQNYHSTSITNGLESIVDQLVIKLMDENFEEGMPVLKVLERFPLMRSFTKSPKELARLRHTAARQKFLDRCRWFEYYPSGSGLGEHETMSLVTFRNEGSPSWSFAPQETFLSEYPADFFKINVDLRAWTTKAN